MDKLLTYLKSLNPEARDEFAKRCGTTVGYLRKAISVNQRLGELLCLRIGLESAGAIKPEDMRPDLDWEYLRKALANTAHPTVEKVASHAPDNAKAAPVPEDKAVVVAVLIASPKVESTHQPDHRVIPMRRTEIPSPYDHSDIDRRDEEVHGRRANNGDAVDVVAKGV